MTAVCDGHLGSITCNYAENIATGQPPAGAKFFFFLEKE
jgi:hypothetical protein